MTETADRRQIALLLDRLAFDYVLLRTTYPAPQSSQTRTSPKGSREYGHPAQWASDTARSIADCLDATDEALRDHLNHLPPPPRVRAECRVVNHAYKSLRARSEYLARFPGAQAFLEEATDIHKTVRRLLGMTRQRKALHVRCPECRQLPVFRTVYDDRRDVIECHHCGYQIKESEYGLYARIVVDELLDEAETNSRLTEPTSQCEHGASG